MFMTKNIRNILQKKKDGLYNSKEENMRGYYSRDPPRKSLQ